MGSYEFLAGCYDALTYDVGYRNWADYLERLFARSDASVHTVLDLACGTGSLTRELALRGYEMIGVDQSEEMLAQAAEKCRDLPGGNLDADLAQGLKLPVPEVGAADRNALPEFLRRGGGFIFFSHGNLQSASLMPFSQCLV